ALYKQGKLEEAIEAYDKAIKLDPKNDYAWNNKGVTLRKQGKLEEAIEAYNKAIKINSLDELYQQNKEIAEKELRK
ncbi:tetratricopeptide repeat protein, partial [Candidatus Woesearchaeota archaeon]|nr:tetratricopeptide repeat protein [Candidatus Woesearchaeota archaeon]